ncbi:type II secretion system protein GspD, partial [Thermodesulfobacteriota bacterium]
VARVLGEIPGKGAEDKKETKAPVLSKDVKISADSATNTLMIIAEPDEYRVLEDIIKVLDVPRTMVFVEVLIMEVSTSKALDLGVQWRLGDDFKGGFQQGTNGGVYSAGSLGAGEVDRLASGTLPSGFSAGVVGRAITLSDGQDLNHGERRRNGCYRRAHSDPDGPGEHPDTLSWRIARSRLAVQGNFGQE